MFPRMFFGISAEREATPPISERNFGFGCGVGLENSLHLGIGKVLSDSLFQWQWCSAATKFLERKGETEQAVGGDFGVCVARPPFRPDVAKGELASGATADALVEIRSPLYNSSMVRLEGS